MCIRDSFITNWGTFGTAVRQLKFPMDVAVDSSGNVYVTDSKNDRIQKFKNDGTYIRTWGASGSGDGQFDLLNGIAVDSSANVYVSENQNRRIQKFETNGIFTWGISRLC